MALHKMNKKKILAILSIIFGVLVIAFPNLLGIIVGLYLIINGVSNLAK